jgi:hypothetical protein
LCEVVVLEWVAFRLLRWRIIVLGCFSVHFERVCLGSLRVVGK